jgi:uncharacterized protein YndB with AHSA1/START domain
MTHAYLGTENPTVEIERVFDAPRARVFEAFTQQKHLERWYGPDGFSIDTTKFDFATGGEWVFTMKSAERGEFPSRLVWDEIVEDELLRFHYESLDESDPADFGTSVSFRDEDGKTVVHFVMLFGSRETRDETVERAGALEGLTQTMNKLEKFLKGEL